MGDQRSTWLWALVGALAVLVLLGPGRMLLRVLLIPWWAMLFLLPFLLVGALVLSVGYLAYRARIAREQEPIEEMMATGPDPVEELSRINDELEATGREASASLDRTREAMEQGLRG